MCTLSKGNTPAWRISHKSLCLSNADWPRCCCAGGGKTACYRCLCVAQAMLGLQQQSRQRSLQQQTQAVTQSSQGAQIANQQSGMPHEFTVHAHVLNPKSIILSELYGAYNLVTHDWTDGLASSLIRAAVADETNDMHWVVFDGPVDAVWVENMNTGGCGWKESRRNNCQGVR